MSDQAEEAQSNSESANHQSVDKFGPSPARRGPQLRTLIVPDDPAAWEAAGFQVNSEPNLDEPSFDGGSNGMAISSVTIGTIQIRFAPQSTGTGINEWVFDSRSIVVSGQSIDGIRTSTTDERPEVVHPSDHPNHATGIDHVVMTSPNLSRTIEALRNAGFEVRRTRDVPNSDRQQVFLWAGDTILELVGPANGPTANSPTQPDAKSGVEDLKPAELWGLAITTEDLAGAARTLGSALSEPKDAVQTGRKVATVATRDLGISVPMILMTPHISLTKADEN